MTGQTDIAVPPGAGPSAPIAQMPCAACGGITMWVPCLEQLHRCASCGFVVYRVADEPSLHLLYDEAYFAGKEYADYLGEQEALRRSMRRHLEQMARFGASGGSLLEVGSAYGLFLDEARAHFSRVAGIDICEGPVRYARETLGLDARHGDFLREEWEGRRFDVVCMWDTIEHLTEPDRFVRRAAELLVPGGMLFLTTGDISSGNAKRRGARWRQIHPPTHVSYFSRSTMSRMLCRSGFEVASIETAAYFHTAFNVLASLQLRGGTGGLIARPLRLLLGAGLARRIGGWIDLGDIMFVAARRVGTAGGAAGRAGRS